MRNFWGRDEDYLWSKYLYSSCDSNSSVVAYFHSGLKELSVGPPLVPFVIAPPWVNIKSAFEIRVVVTANNITDADSLARQVHFYFNDSLNATKPTSVKCVVKKVGKTSRNSLNLCHELVTDDRLTIGLRFNINPYDLKKVSVLFDDSFNKIMHSDHKNLIMLKRTRLHYWPLAWGW